MPVISRRPLIAAGGLAGLFALLSSGARADDSGTLEVSAIRYQSSTSTVVNPLEVADALGYLKPLTLRRVGSVNGGPADIQAAATGQTDIAAAFNGAVLNLAAAGAPVTAVICWRGTDAETSDGLFVLDNSPIAKARDLIGKKVGVNTLGADAEAVLDMYLVHNGLTLAEIREVTLMPLPTPNLEPEPGNGQIGAMSVAGIFRDAALARGGIHPLYRNVDLFGNYSDNTAVVPNDFVARNPRATAHLVAALARAIDWLQQRQGQQDRPQVVDLVTQYFNAHDRASEVAALKYWHGTGIATRGGWIKRQELAMWLPWLTQRGEVDAKAIDLDKVYTNKFNPYFHGQAG